MKEINEILKKNNIHLIEDCAQAIGSKYKGVHVGNFGYAGCYSLHPLKNLSAFGEVVSYPQIIKNFIIG